METVKGTKEAYTKALFMAHASGHTHLAKLLDEYIEEISHNRA